MNKENTSKQQLDEIRNLMERSSRFISLSGLSGISAGIVALIGALIAFFYLRFDLRYLDTNRYFNEKYFNFNRSEVYSLIFLASIVLVTALASTVYFTTRKARRRHLPIWTQTTRLMLYNLTIPLLSGGIFCSILLYHHLVFLIAPSTLVFYGLSLLSASKYTLPEIQWLGICEVVLGLIACIFVGYGLLFWVVGFSFLHIVYGTVMYYRYERGDK
jgi:uncharacterized membrane protein YidH (DUF202 family)